MMDFIDLKQQQKLIRDKVDKRICKVLDHGQYIQGPEVKELEKELSLFSKSKFVLCCSSGTDALVLGLIALGLKPNEGVINHKIYRAFIMIFFPPSRIRLV